MCSCKQALFLLPQSILSSNSKRMSKISGKNLKQTKNSDEEGFTNEKIVYYKTDRNKIDKIAKWHKVKLS